jgi:hypothetical protein
MLTSCGISSVFPSASSALTVCTTSKEIAFEAQAAVDYWGNLASGLSVYLSPDPQNCDVELRFESETAFAWPDKWVAYTAYADETPYLVSFRQTVWPARPEFTVIHEFGHVLGLSHSSDPEDPMAEYPK